MRLIRVATIMALVATGCGGDGDSPTGPSSSRTYREQLVGTVNSFGFVQHALSIPRSGQMSITLNGATAGDLDLYLTGPNCNAYPPRNCTLLANSDSLSGTEQVLRTVTSGEQFKMWVDNFAGRPINYTLTIVIN